MAKRRRNADSILVFDSESAIADVKVLLETELRGGSVIMTLHGNGIGV